MNTLQLHDRRCLILAYSVTQMESLVAALWADRDGDGAPLHVAEALEAQVQLVAMTHWWGECIGQPGMELPDLVLMAREHLTERAEELDAWLNERS
jgi:hypothetical protein